MTNNKTSLPKLRTFAQDLMVHRSNSHPTSTPSLHSIPDKTISLTKKPITTRKIQSIDENKLLSAPKNEQKLPPASVAISQHIGTTTIKKSPVPIIHTKQKTESKAASIHTSIPTHNISALLPTHHKTAASSQLPTTLVKPTDLHTPLSKTVKHTSRNKAVTDRTYRAVVITDTKHKRFHLISEILKSLKIWWGHKVQTHTESKKPKYTVTDADRRKGVIQKATTTARANTADHTAVLKQIRSSKKNNNASHTTHNESSNVLIASDHDTDKIATKSTLDRQHIPHHHTTHTVVNDVHTDTQTHPNMNTAISTRDETFKSLPIDKKETRWVTDLPHENTALATNPKPVILPIIPDPIKADTPTPESTEYEHQTIESNISTSPIPATSTIPVSDTHIIHNVSSETDTHTTENIPTSIAVPSSHIWPIIPNTPTTSDTVVPKLSNKSEPDHEYETDTNSTSTSSHTSNISDHVSSRLLLWRQNIFTFLKSFQPIQNPNQLVFATLLGITILFIIYVSSNTLLSSHTPSVSTPPVTTLFNTAVQYREVPDGANKQAIFTQLMKKKNSQESLTEVVFTTTSSGPNIAAPTMVTLLGFSLSPDFIATLKHVTFGYYRGEPWLLLSTADKTTSQGGMLQWETTMSSDLSPWFGSPITPTKTNSLTGFMDGVIAHTDIRSLRDTQGTNHITYGFLNAHTILITTTSTTFLNLASNFTDR